MYSYTAKHPKVKPTWGLTCRPFLVSNVSSANRRLARTALPPPTAKDDTIC